MHKLKRLPDWPSRLDAYVQAMRAEPFTWAAHNCVTFAAGAVRAVCGTCPAVPQWQGARQALRMLRAHNGMAAAVEGVNAFETTGVRQARRGDLLLTDQPHGPALAVCLGHVWAAPSRGGLVFGPALHALTAWRVG